MSPKRPLAVVVVVGVGAASKEGATCLCRFHRMARLPTSVVVPDCLAAVECSNCLRRTHSLGLESFFAANFKKIDEEQKFRERNRQPKTMKFFCSC